MNKYLLLAIVISGLSCNSKKQTSDLHTRIESTLVDAIKKFEPTNNAFLLTIYHQDTAILQIIHRSYIEQTRKPNDEFGFVIHLAFDPTFPEEVEKHDKFKTMSIFSSFVYYEWDGIPCYALDFDKDTSKGAEIIITLLKDLYGYDTNTELEIELLDQGHL
jgi:hypothetical protein